MENVPSFSLLPAAGIGLVVSAGEMLGRRARTIPRWLFAMCMRLWPVLGPCLFHFAGTAVFNVMFAQPQLGVSLYGYSLGFAALLTSLLWLLLLVGVQFGVRRVRP
jgi:hypothetical protein